MSAALLSNDRTHVGAVRSTLDKSYGMLSAGAYLHQYEKYGHGAADMMHALARVEEALGHYASV